MSAPPPPETPQPPNKKTGARIGLTVGCVVGVLLSRTLARALSPDLPNGINWNQSLWAGAITAVTATFFGTVGGAFDKPKPNADAPFARPSWQGDPAGNRRRLLVIAAVFGVLGLAAFLCLTFIAGSNPPGKP
jgi:hypothetical protein